MKKIIPIKFEKIWGYEVWLSSPIEGKETKLEDGKAVNFGPLIKIIKANQPLSVQVHPDDKFAKELENQNNGKSESWYILECDKNATLVSGLKTYNEQIIREKLKDGSFEEILKNVHVKRKDFFNIPAGLVHGIGAGIKLFEVQQPSDVTYRYFDYNRLENGKPRELHVDKAIRVQKSLSHELKPISRDPLVYKNEVGFQEYWKVPTVVTKKSIVVNFKEECAYLAEANDVISFNDYCIIPLS